MIATAEIAIAITGHATGSSDRGRASGNPEDGSGEPMPKVAVAGSPTGSTGRAVLRRPGEGGPETARSLVVRFPSDGSAEVTCGFPVCHAARSVLQCLQRPATG